MSAMKSKGIVYLVGAGPGDAGLLTVRGAELLARAGVVVYDALVNKELLRLAPPEAELIYAGKRSSDHAIPQDATQSIARRKGPRRPMRRPSQRRRSLCLWPRRRGGGAIGRRRHRL
jgi:siroheme synthase